MRDLRATPSETGVRMRVPRWRGVVIALLLLAVAASARAEQAAIHLTDGSTLRGEVVGLTSSGYRVRSSALGEMTIPQSRVRVIEYGGATSEAAPVDAPTANDTGGLQSSIMARLSGNPALLQSIMSLSDAPEMRAVIEDPDIQRAIAAGDYASLLRNPKMRRLMSNAKVRSITNELK
ncbi:MAG: hypothetical protein AAF515_19665 [Pseudomonadota bacterium]